MTDSPNPKTSKATEPGGTGITLPDGSSVSASDVMWGAYQKACDAGMYTESAEGLAEWIEDQYILAAEQLYDPS